MHLSRNTSAVQTLTLFLRAAGHVRTSPDRPTVAPGQSGVATLPSSLSPRRRPACAATGPRAACARPPRRLSSPPPRHAAAARPGAPDARAGEPPPPPPPCLGPRLPAAPSPPLLPPVAARLLLAVLSLAVASPQLRRAPTPATPARSGSTVPARLTFPDPEISPSHFILQHVPLFIAS